MAGDRDWASSDGHRLPASYGQQPAMQTFINLIRPRVWFISEAGRECTEQAAGHILIALTHASQDPASHSALFCRVKHTYSTFWPRELPATLSTMHSCILYSAALSLPWHPLGTAFSCLSILSFLLKRPYSLQHTLELFEELCVLILLCCLRDTIIHHAAA